MNIPVTSSSPFQRVPEGVLVSKARRSGLAQITVPGSKSLTNRMLLLAGLAEGASTLNNGLESEDTVYMRQALTALGVSIQQKDTQLMISPPASLRPPEKPLFVGNAGTAMRFLASALATQPFQSRLEGNERMAKRPIGDLVEGLRALGADVNYVEASGYPPIDICGPATPGQISIRGDASSQYLSGLLMALPLLDQASKIVVDGPLVSITYVEMTLQCMRAFGIQATADPQFKKFEIPAGTYRGGIHHIEPDASTASYWMALPFMAGGSILIRDVPRQSTQGDFGLLDILEQMGGKVERSEKGVLLTESKLKGIDVNMNTMSDVAPTLAVVATMAGSPTRITDIGNMRIKECDRINCLQTAFDQLGLGMTSGPDWIEVQPGAPTRSAILDPEDDHRMAMVFALLGFAYGGVTIKTPECTAKTYPGFYEDMAGAF